MGQAHSHAALPRRRSREQLDAAARATGRRWPAPGHNWPFLLALAISLAALCVLALPRPSRGPASWRERQGLRYRWGATYSSGEGRASYSFWEQVSVGGEEPGRVAATPASRQADAAGASTGSSPPAVTSMGADGNATATPAGPATPPGAVAPATPPPPPWQGFGDGLCAAKEQWLLRQQAWPTGSPSVPEQPICWQGEGLPRGPALPRKALLPLAGSGLDGGAAEGCAAALSVPKVALMFLTKGTLPHAATWTFWLDQAAGLAPLDCAVAGECEGGTGAGRFGGALGSACRGFGQPREGSTALERQLLFSVYVHLPPGGSLQGNPSLFSRHVLRHRIKTEWGGFSLAEAGRVLLAEALGDPLNQRFVLLSESCLPLYPPAAFYQQLMYRGHSKIDACAPDEQHRGRIDPQRYTWRMQLDTKGALRKEHWRKSQQWVALTRKHAQVIADDTVTAPVFEKYCKDAMDPDKWGQWRTCYSDEHFFPTILAVHGLDEETDCTGRMTHTEFCFDEACGPDGSKHPRAFAWQECRPQLFSRLRGTPAREGAACAVDAVLRWGSEGFLDLRQDFATWGQARLRAAPALLDPACPLLARKFPAPTAPYALGALYQLFLDEALAQQRAQAAPQANATLEQVGAWLHQLRPQGFLRDALPEELLAALFEADEGAYD